MAPQYVMHVFPFSLYSIMARLTHALGRQDSSEGPEIEYRLNNLHRDENTTQAFLKLNPKGQVPVLTSDALPAPLTDSVDISYWLAGFYPKLLPTEYESEIRQLVQDVHAIQGLCLSVPAGRREDVVSCPDVDELLASDSIDDEYRKALKFKRQFHMSDLGTALTEERVRDAEQRVTKIFQQLTDRYDGTGTWLFGTGPTVADAHIAPLIARMMEAPRLDLIPETLQKYARGIMSLPAWDEVTHGRPTTWNVSLGHVALLSPI